MVINNRRQETLVSKWIAAESIYYLKNKHPWLTETWAGYIKTRIQKILFHVAEKNDLNITRCWYLHGAFVAAYDLFTDFNVFSKRYVRSRKGPTRFRSEAKKYVDDFDTVYDDIIKIATFIDDFKTVDEYLDYLYNKEAPDEYKNIYKSKHELSRSSSNLSYLANLTNDYVDDQLSVLKKINKVYDDITEFQMSAFSYSKEELVEKNTIKFFNELEDSIRKFELLVLKERDIEEYPLDFFNKSKKVFVDFVWKPYASEISRETAKGLRKNDIKTYARRWKKTALDGFPSKLLTLLRIKNSSNLLLSWDEVKEYNEYRSNDELDNKLLKLISVYDKFQDK